MVSLSSFFYLLLLQQIFQVIIARDALQFLLHNLLHLFLDTPVVRLHRFFHAVVAVLVREIGNDRNFLVGYPLVMGIVNVNNESFYESSRVTGCSAFLQRIDSMINGGAKIIYIGGWSTSPGSIPVFFVI